MERTFTVTHRGTHAGTRRWRGPLRCVAASSQAHRLPLIAVSRPPGDGRALPPRLDPRGGRGRPGDAAAPRRQQLSGRRRLVRGTRIVAAVASALLLLGSGYGWAAY